MTGIKIFENNKIRSQWNESEETWYFSVVDVCAVFSGSKTPRNYWSDLKRKLKKEGSELHENLVQLKLKSNDGKRYKTDALSTKWLLRLVQSIPSPKAEPFKMWLAKVGSERLEEIVDPEKAFQRGADFYREKGYPAEWITQRMLSIKVRKELTDEWKNRGIESELDYAILTNEITRAWSGLTVKEYKSLKNLKSESLRDNMTDIELTLNQLAELTTKTISQQEKPNSMEKNKDVARRGGRVASVARAEFEKSTKTKVISAQNAKNKEALSIKNGSLLQVGSNKKE